MTDIKSMTPEELAGYFKELGQPSFRAGQVFRWLHQGVESFDEMTDLPKALREALRETCTLLRRENEDVVDGFLAEHSDFVPEPFEFAQFGVQPGMMTFWPHIHDTDGFFVAKLRRKGAAPFD